MDLTVETMQYLGCEGNKKYETETGSKKLVLVLRTRLAQATHLVFGCQSSLQYVQKYFDKNNVKAHFSMRDYQGMK